MRNWILSLENILRGDSTRLVRLREGPLDIPAGGLTLLIVVLGAFYGFCMGCLTLVTRESEAYAQVLASMVKVPALFLLTLFVTFPSLYVFNALVGSRLTRLTLYRLLIAALGVTLAVLASFGPIVAFFSLTTTSYPFMVLLNVLIFGISGMLGLAFLLQTLHRLTLLDIPDPVVAPVPSPAAGTSDAPVVAPAEPAGALGRMTGSVLGANVKTVFFCWVVLFGLVGAQMGWILRPFIGNPVEPFEWFRARESNFFQAVWRSTPELVLVDK